MARYRRNSAESGIAPSEKLLALEAKASNPATDERSLVAVMKDSDSVFFGEKPLHRGNVKEFVKQLFSVWRAVVKNPNLSPDGLLRMMRDGRFSQSQYEEQRSLPLDFVDNPAFPLHAMSGSLPDDLVEDLASMVQAKLLAFDESNEALFRGGYHASHAGYGAFVPCASVVAYAAWSDTVSDQIPRVDRGLVMAIADILPKKVRERLVAAKLWPSYMTPNRRR